MKPIYQVYALFSYQKNQEMLHYSIALLCFFCTIGGSIAQTIDQRELLAAQQISEQRIIKYRVQHGAVQQDSNLIALSRFNTLGLPILEQFFDSMGLQQSRWQYSYQEDSILLSKARFDKNDSLTTKSHFYYDALGLTSLVNTLKSHSKAVPDTHFYRNIYDEGNRLIESRLDEGKGKFYIFNHYYDSSGNRIKISAQVPNRKGPLVTCMEFNEQHHLIRKYTLDKGRIWYPETFVYNPANQRIETHSVSYRKSKKHFFSLQWASRQKKAYVEKHFYDARGLLVREEFYSGSILKGFKVYRYD